MIIIAEVGVLMQQHSMCQYFDSSLPNCSILDKALDVIFQCLLPPPPVHLKNYLLFTLSVCIHA